MGDQNWINVQKFGGPPHSPQSFPKEGPDHLLCVPRPSRDPEVWESGSGGYGGCRLVADVQNVSFPS